MQMMEQVFFGKSIIGVQCKLEKNQSDGQGLSYKPSPEFVLRTLAFMGFVWDERRVDILISIYLRTSKAHATNFYVKRNFMDKTVPLFFFLLKLKKIRQLLIWYSSVL